MLYILPVVLFSLLWNVSRFLELDTCYYMKNFTMEDKSVEVLILLVQYICVEVNKNQPIPIPDTT